MMMLDVSTCSFLYNKMKVCDSVTSTKLAKYYVLEILPDVRVLCILPAVHVDRPHFVDANKPPDRTPMLEQSEGTHPSAAPSATQEATDTASPFSLSKAVPAVTPDLILKVLCDGHSHLCTGLCKANTLVFLCCPTH